MTRLRDRWKVLDKKRARIASENRTQSAIERLKKLPPSKGAVYHGGEPFRLDVPYDSPVMEKVRLARLRDLKRERDKWEREEDPSTVEATPVVQTTARPAPTPKLKTASVAAIRSVIEKVYDDATIGRAKPPNIKQLGHAVRPLLNARGLDASLSAIMRVGNAPEFKDWRIPTGKRQRPNGDN